MLPLTGKRILITRSRHQASELSALLEALGATPILIPTIEIAPPATYGPLDAALAHLDRFDWLLFTSANAVESFHRRRVALEERMLQPSIGETTYPADRSLRIPNAGQTQEPKPGRRPKIAAIGPATARSVESIGFAVDLVPPQYVAESLAETLASHAPGTRMLLIRAAEARDLLPEALTQAGAAVTIVEAYRNQIPPDSISALRHLFAQPENYPDAITFTSASTARNLIGLLHEAGLTLPETITLASIGPITSQTLRELGHAPTIEAASPTLASLVESFLLHFNATQNTLIP